MVLVSVICPCYNGAAFLRPCLESVLRQTHRPLELSFWDDCSTDESPQILQEMRPRFDEAGIKVVNGRTQGEGPRGCGYAKNRCREQASGVYFCYLDADDVMTEDRVVRQLEVAEQKPGTIVGCNIWREPEDATPRYVKWINSMKDEDLLLQRYVECTVMMPTWFCHRDVISDFSENGKGTPEDLIMFYDHLRRKRPIAKVDKAMLMYRQHAGQTSVTSVPASIIWDVRVDFIQTDLLDNIDQFTIWSAGRDGKKFFRQLKPDNRTKCAGFLDVAKIGNKLYDKELKQHFEVRHFTTEEVVYPIIILVKRGLHEGFEDNLASLGLVEGIHYWHFN